MTVKEYMAIKNNIKKNYPAGLSYLDFDNLESLWKKIANTDFHNNISTTKMLHKINISIIKEQNELYRKEMVKLYIKLKLLNRMYRTHGIKDVSKRVDERINYLYNIMYSSKENTKMSKYGLSSNSIKSTA